MIRKMKMQSSCAAAMLLFALASAGCKKTEDQATQAQASVDSEQATTMATTSDTTSDTTEPAQGAATGKAFDIDSVPVSTAPLGTFPYFTLPQGYENPNEQKPPADLDRVPFWTGDRLEWVEGKVFEQPIYAKEGKQYSQFEVEKNIDHLIAAAGGVKITKSKIPKAVLEANEDEIGYSHTDGIGDIYNEPARTYLIRRADRNIWVHFASNGVAGNWMIAETTPFVPTATLLPAAQPKQ